LFLGGNNMDRFSAMAVFAKVVEEESFSRASEVLCLSKSAVSKQVSALEAELGVRLLNRTTRRLSLTEAGRTFFEGCRRMVGEAEEAERAVGQLSETPIGSLRVSAPMSFGFLHLIPAIETFMTRYPDIEVDMSLNDRFVDVVEEGFDLAVRIGQLKDSSLIARKLAPSRNVVCASADYLERRGRPARPGDLRDHDCLIYCNPQPRLEWSFRGPGGLQKVRVRAGRFRVNNGDALRSAACQGLGIVRLPTFILGNEVRMGRLEVLLPDYPAPQEEVFAVFPHGRHLPLKVRVFVDFLAERFGTESYKGPYWDQGVVEER